MGSLFINSLACLTALTGLFLAQSEEGQSFLRERLPRWQHVVDSKDEFGVMRYEQMINDELAETTVRFGKDGFLYGESASRIREPDVLQIRFANPEYMAVVRAKNETFSLSGIWEQTGAGYWDYPFLMGSSFKGEAYPKLIESGELVLKEYSKTEGLHSFLYLHEKEGETLQFFFDDVHALPVKCILTYKEGGGVLVAFENFQPVADTELPSVIHVEMSGSGDEPSTFGKFDMEYSSEPFDTQKCYLEYYGLANPDLKFAKMDQQNNWKYTLYLAFGLAMLVVGFFLVKKIRK